MVANAPADNMFREVFDAIPSMVFVVDDDVKIQEYNVAAAVLLGARKSVVLKRRGGEAMHCIHSQETPAGCGGAPACQGCVIRNSVKEASTGKRVVRCRHKMELVQKGVVREVNALITAVPFSFHRKQLVLLTVEDISELVQLQGLIPICSWCGKVRKDKDYWVMVESYLQQHLDLSFTHGICPSCQKTQIKELRQTGNLKKQQTA